MRRDSARLPVLEESHARFESGIRSLVEEALRPFGPPAEHVELARALVDVRVWESLREHGLGPDEAVETASRALAAALPARAGKR